MLLYPAENKSGRERSACSVAMLYLPQDRQSLRGGSARQ